MRLKRIRFQMRICVRGSELSLRPARTPAVRPAFLPNAKRRPSNARSSLSRTTSPSTPTYISKDGGPYRYVQHRDPQRSRVQGQGHGHGRLRVRTPTRPIAGKIAKRRDRATRRFAAPPRLRPRRSRATSRRARPPGFDGFARGSERQTRMRASFPRHLPASTLPSAADRAPCLGTPSTVASRSSSRRSRCPVSCP